MSRIKTVKEDLFSTNDNLCHGVNCKGAFGKGIAVAFKARFPEMYARYNKICTEGNLRPGDMFVHVHRNPQTLTKKHIFNLAIKDHWKNPATYEALQQSIKRMVFYMVKNNIKSVSMPWIGCGLGGLEKTVVYKMLESAIENKGVEITIYEL